MKKLFYFILVLLVLGAGAAAWYLHLVPTMGPAAVGKAVDTTPYTVPAAGETYTNDTYKFSLTMPQGFTAREATGDTSTTAVLEDGKSNGIQITITPVDEDIQNLTKERIQQDIPDLVITDEQPVEIGANHTGLAFKSDNKAFDGASREVWFVFRGNLYQISTYERLDPLLKNIFATWKFF